MEKYVKPELIIIEFESEDIITDSDFDSFGNGEVP